MVAERGKIVIYVITLRGNEYPLYMGVKKPDSTKLFYVVEGYCYSKKEYKLVEYIPKIRASEAGQ